MLRGDHVIEFCGSDVVWFGKRDVGREADLSQPYADGGGYREREVESEKRAKTPLNGNVSYRALMYIVIIPSCKLRMSSAYGVANPRAWKSILYS